MDLRTLIESVAQGVTSIGQSPDGPQRIWQESRAYVTRLLSSATQKWIPYYAQQNSCAVLIPKKQGGPSACGATAVLPCICCGQPTCLHHAQVDQHGDGTCYGCIAETIGRKRGQGVPGPGTPPPPSVEMAREMIVARALKTLGLKRGASWDQIRAAHRKLAAKVHPDNAKNDAERKARAAESVRLNSALADLTLHYQPEARVA